MLHSGLNRSGITRMSCLKVWFVRVGDGIDLPKLEMVAFGNSSFVMNERLAFKGGFVNEW